MREERLASAGQRLRLAAAGPYLRLDKSCVCRNPFRGLRPGMKIAARTRRLEPYVSRYIDRSAASSFTSFWKPGGATLQVYPSGKKIMRQHVCRAPHANSESRAQRVPNKTTQSKVEPIGLSKRRVSRRSNTASRHKNRVSRKSGTPSLLTDDLTGTNHFRVRVGRLEPRFDQGRQTRIALSIRVGRVESLCRFRSAGSNRCVDSQARCVDAHRPT